MISSKLGFIEDPEGEDILSVYRERLLFRFAIFFTALFLILMIFNFIRGQNALGTALGCVMVIALLNAAALRFKKSISIARAALIIGMSVVVGIALLNRGAYGTYWTFPVLIFISFSVPHKLAKIYTAIFFVYVSLLIFYLLDFSFGLRAVVGLFITLRFMNIFLGLIEKLQEKLVEQSLKDPLTKAFNRRQMMSSLEEAIERKRRTDTPASILVFDIDDFKCVNDTHGHAAGDRVLTEFAALVSNRARRLDQLFRIGGEEFLLFLPDTPENGALTLAEEILGLVSETVFIEDYPITVSVGLSELHKSETVDEWVKHGDSALYAAKENGKNRVFNRPKAKTPEKLNAGKGNYVKIFNA